MMTRLSLTLLLVLFPSWTVVDAFGVNPKTIQKDFQKALTTGAVAAVTLFGGLNHAPQPAMAADSRVVGQIAGSGLVFKDTLVIESFEDPKVRTYVRTVGACDGGGGGPCDDWLHRSALLFVTSSCRDLNSSITCHSHCHSLTTITSSSSFSL